MVNSRGGTFTPSQAQQQNIVTGISHSPHSSHHSTFSTAASPSTNSPTTGTNSLTKIVVAQVYLLLSTIKEDKDLTKLEQQVEQLRKLVNDHGMEVFQKYFSRLVFGNAGQIFPGLNRPTANAANYAILVSEIKKISHDVGQAGKIAESIETANEDIFRDFDLSTFMDHFKLDALEKTILALAFKTGSRSDLKTKADAILTANYSQFLQLIFRPRNEHEDLTSEFLTIIIDRYIQEPPPNFDSQSKADLALAVHYRYQSANGQDNMPPAVVLASLYLVHSLSQSNQLAMYIHSIGSAFTMDEEACRSHIQQSGISLDEGQLSAAIIYTAISRTHSYSPSTLVNSARNEVSANFSWDLVVANFDQPDLRISKYQFLTIYEALRPLAADQLFDIQRLWGGSWQNSETQLSFLSAFASLSPDELDATTIPGLRPSFTLEDLASPEFDPQGRAPQAIRHPLVSLEALSAMFHVALHASTASDTPEAKRLFQEVVVPNLDIFVVSGAGVPKPWPELATDTVHNLFDRFLYKMDPNYDFVLESLWRRDKGWVAQRLVDAHAKAPLELLTILDHALRHDWLEDLVSIPNGFGLDLASIAHARGSLDLEMWEEKNASKKNDLASPLLTFLNIKAQHEIQYQRDGTLRSMMLPVKTIHHLLHILEEWLPKNPTMELIVVQRSCITSYPRLINYGDEFDDIIDANGATDNSLPEVAIAKMEEHYKRMYSDDLQVRNVVEALDSYKHSRHPIEQDIFACMIHGLFDEYALYHTYPLEALATTAVLFGGIISHKLISDLPLEIGLGMILEAVRDYTPDNSMYKFGLQALMQLFARLIEWPGFCRQLLQVPGLQGTEAWNKAEDVIRIKQDEENNDGLHLQANGRLLTNGIVDDLLAAEPSFPQFSAVYVDPPPPDAEDPDEATQDRIQFVLNNITNENLEAKFQELKDVINERNQVWFAGHLVQERAKMQPNYHGLYLDLVKLFHNKSLWKHILRETYASAFRTLNSEATMEASQERTNLKNLAIWLGSLTLARDQPILHKNISFKQLLSEGYQTQRLIVVIPFVCKILAQGQHSLVFKPPNPWLMDILSGLMELYLKADIKLNLRFEIEVLCSDLKVNPKDIIPSDEIMNRPLPIEEPLEIMALDNIDRFDNMSLNGVNGEVGNGRFSSQEITASIPDLGPLLTYPPGNDMVNQTRLMEIVKTAITRAVHEIISPVVERSVTIAAISTKEMIKKDFATEPNEARVRSAAINMVKKTAGSLALVTSKEPLRASMTNYIRALSAELSQGLPEGTIIMCVNSNLDTACSQVEKKAEERAVPEIEDMIEGELELRRIHRASQANEPYMDSNLNRWSWTIPNPYKMQPTLGGLNQEQMAIYDDFAKQQRVQPLSITGPSHVPSSSDATRSMANEILQDPYQSITSIPTPAEQPARPHLITQQSNYSQAHSAVTNGRISAAAPMDTRTVIDRVASRLNELQHAAAAATEQHYADLPRPSDVLQCLDGLYDLIIRSSQGQEAYDVVIIDQICQLLFSGVDQELVIECLVHVLENSCRIGGRTASRVSIVMAMQSGDSLLNVPLAVSLIKAGIIEWQKIDLETAKAIQARRDGSLRFLSSLVDAVLLNEQPIALHGDFARSLELAWQWIGEEPSLEIGQELKIKLTKSGVPSTLGRDHQDQMHQDQMEYVFEEWIHLCVNTNASDKAAPHFISQLYNKQIINSRDDMCLFLRLAIDISVDRHEQHIQNDSSSIDAYVPVDALAKLIMALVKGYKQDGEVKNDRAAFLDLILSTVVLILNHHHVMRGEHFNQKVFLRLFSILLCEFATNGQEVSDQEREEILLVFAAKLLDLRPSYFPGFICGWLTLVSHRNFLHPLMRIPDHSGWNPLADIIESLMLYVGDLFKPLQVPPLTKMIHHSVLKLLAILHHDFPEFVAANQYKFSASIPRHCVQLHNLILNSTPGPFSKGPDPLQEGLKVDRIEDIRNVPDSLFDNESIIRKSGLSEVLDHALAIRPSEDALAHISHAIQQKRGKESGLGFVPVNADLELIRALVMYIGRNSIARAELKGGPTYVATAPDAVLLSMLIHELRPEPRYYFLSAVIDQLRGPNAYTHYFSQAVLELFGSDLSDPEEIDIRQQVTRLLLERLIPQWPQPWGLIVTIMELVKNEKHMFFELPFIKSVPEVGERFIAIAAR